MSGDPVEVRNVAGERHGRRSMAALSNRTLIEMALCNASSTEGIESSYSSFDALVSKVAVLIELARMSDGVYRELIDPEIIIFPNGTIGFETDSLESIIWPFSQDIFKGLFSEAAKKYPDFYKEKATEGHINNYSQDFLEAFQDEYKLSFDNLVSVLGELIDLAVENDNSVVIVNTSELKERLINNQKLPIQAFQAVVNCFVLAPRKNWSVIPCGFMPRDFQPWHFQRRLSVVYRPLIQIDEGNDPSIIYGTSQLRESFNYIIENIREGWLRQDSISSKKMQAYIGEVARIKGELFENKVLEKFCSRGMIAKIRVQMTQLGGPAELGDVDILAWDDINEKLFVVEVKRLKLARTLSEIADILDEFKGEDRDRLGRHLTRVSWINNNLHQIKKFFNLKNELNPGKALLITNIPIPLKFKKNIPIDQESIMTINQIPFL